MRKFLISGLMSVALLTTGAMPVLANAPVIVLDPIGSLEYATFPQVYDVTGSVSHGSGTNGLNPVNSVNLYVDNVLHATQDIPNGSGEVFNFTLPWTVSASGSYVVKVTAVHGGAEGSDEEAVEVTLLEEEVVIDACDAAPAVANAYMQANGFKSNSKEFKNVISLVAKNMTQGADFNGIAACDAAAYAAEVQAYVNANLNSVSKK